MWLLIFKSSVCLTVFLTFYKLFLENTSAHTFKRFYLIVVILLSIGIPFITYTEYIEIPAIEPLESHSNFIYTKAQETSNSTNYTPIILWSVYALGVLIFCLRFLNSLFNLYKKIKTNIKHKDKSFIHVLLNDYTPPHTFFNFIFFNKTKYELNEVPKEVIIHEQTHAKQKHSIDILFIEILQIAFWFNPLVYIIKKAIKLNHEFLADQAVIKHGSSLSTYQNTLLAFSSNASYSTLANAINYSLIKKRFTVMNTKTSKKTIWLKNLLIFPILAILIFSFSSKVIVEKTTNSQFTEQTTDTDKITLHIDRNRIISINDKIVLLENLSSKLETIKKHKSSNPLVYIQAEGTLSNTYLYKLKKEVEKANLFIKEVKANYITLNETDKYGNSFKGIIFTADSLHFTKKKGEIIQGISIPKKTTTKRKAESYYKIKNDEQNSLKQGILNILITEENNILINYFSINPDSLNDILLNLMNALTEEEKEQLIVNLNTFKNTPKETINQVTKTLRDNNIVKINYQLATKQGVSDEELKNYNSLAKKINDNPEGIFKLKDIKKITELYSKMTDEQKIDSQPYPIKSPNTDSKIAKQASKVIGLSLSKEIKQ
ncbi:M56 family metallopeptidase [Aestuariibaculum sediminum]|uniref:Biopolymer transporter ExbD n=1 Tax=Aestuariibaculum sediminum TaxID=2770637 RepID=A0A8J6Q5M8_9FLAO|nr:M56 family metallopeptidase [Aestuariibaculum sediminum]MBD0830868.1 biopolymer transporter ExbD [Aestuariibaculum sediminum]